MTLPVKEMWAARQAGDCEVVIETARTWHDRLFELDEAELADLGEIHRCAGLCAHKEGGDAARWRQRALIAYGLSNCTNGIALMLVPEAFASWERTGDATAAAAMMSHVRDLADDEARGGPPGVLVRRLGEEKRGFFLAELGDLEEAAVAYARAEPEAASMGDRRGVVKCALGSVRVKWLADVGEPSLVRRQEELIEALSGLGPAGRDVRDPAVRNLERMREGSARLEPYEQISPGVDTRWWP